MRLVVAGALVALLATAASVRADATTDSAKALYKRGLGAYALGRYADAAEAYEAAFAIEPDPALLYNAAQSHRAAGNKARALTLYRNYLLAFPASPNRGDVQRHIATLQKAIESDQHAATEPPNEPARPRELKPEPKPEPKPELPPVVAPRPEPAPVTNTIVVAPPEKKKRPAWFWGVVAGGAVVVVGVGLGVGLGIGLSGRRFPRADIGDARLE